MLLAVDVGNTQTVLGVYEDDVLKKMWRIGTSLDDTADEMRMTLYSLFQVEGFCFSCITGAVLATVVPSQKQLWDQVCKSAFGISIVSIDECSVRGLIGVAARGAGADRLANAVAATKLYGFPVIVVDMGTATDMEVVDKDGVFLGGAIAPGIQTSLHSLVKGTSLLPAIELSRPDLAIGSETVEAIRSGVVLGEVDRIDGLVRRMWKQLGYRTPVIATGGLSGTVGSLCETITTIDPGLTLQGLRIVFEHAKG